jgi:TolB-like protein/DNA-binding winged helix-turn-helix (wHTH) protein
MDNLDRSRRIWRFGIFEADVDAGELRRNGAKIRLQDQPFQILTVLLARAGKLVSREDLCREVWREGTFVEFDHALNTAVKKIRMAIGDDAVAPRYIETIPKRGYRFIAPVQPAKHATDLNVADLASNKSTTSVSWKIAGTVCVVVAVVVTGFAILHRARVAQAQEGKRVMLAVLPFENVSGDVGQESLCDGITQELITQLGRGDPRLGIAARSRVLPYRHTPKGAAQIGSELQVDYLMEGSLRRDGEHVRVTAELVRVSDQARIWGDNFDGENNNDLLVVESDLAKAIAARVRSDVLPAVP